jgi:hypothetical protein
MNNVDVGKGKLTKTLVSSGKELRVLFRAVCISSALPSKNLPQPETSQFSHDLL